MNEVIDDLSKLSIRSLKKLREDCRKRRKSRFWQQRLREVDTFLLVKQGKLPRGMKPAVREKRKPASTVVTYDKLKEVQKFFDEHRQEYICPETGKKIYI